MVPVAKRAGSGALRFLLSGVDIDKLSPQEVAGFIAPCPTPTRYVPSRSSTGHIGEIRKRRSIGRSRL